MLPAKKGRARAVEKIIFLVIVVLFCETCIPTKSIKSSSKFYSTKNFKSVDNRSYLSLNFFHYNEKKKPIPAFYYINGIIFGPKKNLKFDVINVRPGFLKIIGGYVNKEKAQAKIKISKGDSVVIKIFLKDSSKPLD